MTTSSSPLKILIVGAPTCGKSVVANHLTGQPDLTKVPYRPTKGVRILETDVQELQKSEDTLLVAKHFTVELWDVGGDRRVQQYWNALLYGADGAMLFYNGERAEPEKELETLIYFLQQRQESAILKPLPLSKIIFIAYHQVALERSKFSLTSRLPKEYQGKVKEIHASLTDNASGLEKEFRSFTTDIYQQSKIKK